jgi:hypothetical protein
VTLEGSQAKRRAQLYERKLVKSEQINERGAWELELELSAADYQRFFGG